MAINFSATAQEQDDINILFPGNSFTFRHDHGPATVVFEGEEKHYLQQVAYNVPPEHYYDYLTERPEWAGLWFNIGSTPQEVVDMEVDFAGIGGRERWSSLEPQKGVYDFSSIKKKLEDAAESDSYYYFVLWTGPHSPNWIYDHGVPKVRTDKDNFPYYLDEDYQNYIVAFFDTLAASIAGYGPDIANRLAFVQPGFGSTGDRQLYKGTPEDSQYDISKEQYVSFMKKMTTAFTAAFGRHESTADVMFLWNIDDYDGSDTGQLEGHGEMKQAEMIYGAWMKENFNCQLRKQQFTTAIGYMSPNEMNQDNEQRENFFGRAGRWGGNPEFVRGEFNDDKWANTPLAELNKTLHYYWTSISSVDRGLDGWECKELKEEYKEAYSFSHRYSFYKRAAYSPLAFIVLRDVLDYSDQSRFPQNEYGEASRTNQNRIDKILAQYENYGAQNDDNEAVKKLSQAGYLLDVKGHNDCTWNVIARNYRRFITQIDPNETSAGYWRVGITQDQPYGRFARGFDVQNGKNAMYFDVDSLFFKENRVKNDGNLTVKVIYYAEDGGSWSLKYHARDGTMKTAQTVNNEGPGSGWKTIEITLTDALLDNGGDRGADIIIEGDGQTNCRFHMVELVRNISSSYIPVEGVHIEQDAIELNARYTIQLTATLSPANATNQSVSWSSSDHSVATVNAYGFITAISEGTATITVTTHDGGFTANCSVTVSSLDNTRIVDHKVNHVKVYPNPVSTTLFVENNNADISMAQIRIFNLHGQLIHLQESTDKLIAFDLERLPLQGMIMLQLIIGEKVDMHKVIVR